MGEDGKTKAKPEKDEDSSRRNGVADAISVGLAPADDIVTLDLCSQALREVDTDEDEGCETDDFEDDDDDGDDRFGNSIELSIAKSAVGSIASGAAPRATSASSSAMAFDPAPRQHAKQ